MKRVAFDTSVLLLLYEGVPVFEEAAELLLSNPDCVVPKQVVEELERLAAASGLHRRKAARLALMAVQRYCEVRKIDGDTADDALIALATMDPELIVATADRELRRRLRELGLPSIYYRRSRHGLMLEA